jgi:uncharacterized protein
MNTEEWIEVRASGIHGDGAFARKAMRAGQAIGIYAGKRYSAAQYRAIDCNQPMTYLFALTDGSYIDGRNGGNATRHINHSCTPNCVAYEVPNGRGGLDVVIEARRRIRAGEELFLDYALDIGDDDPSAYRCHCGRARCRGTMADLAA